MGKENDLMVEFLRDNQRFADLFNGGLFAGECVVKAEDLERDSENYTEFRTTVATKEPSSKKEMNTVPRSRDVTKRLKSGAELRILSIEEQSHIDYTMPWRCMNYDALEYGRQVQEIRRRNKMHNQTLGKNEFLCSFQKNDRLVPIFTICLYHGAEPWDGPRNLSDMMCFGSDEQNELWAEYFSDYRMRLICVNELQDITTFTTSLKELFAILPYRKDKQEMKKFLEKHDEYRHLDEETARTISGLIGVKKFMTNKENYAHEGEYDMCQAIREMMQENWNEGELAGIQKGINQGIDHGVSLSAAIFRAINSGITNNEQIARECHCTVDEVQKIRTAFKL